MRKLTIAVLAHSLLFGVLWGVHVHKRWLVGSRSFPAWTQLWEARAGTDLHSKQRI